MAPLEEEGYAFRSFRRGCEVLEDSLVGVGRRPGPDRVSVFKEFSDDSGRYGALALADPRDICDVR